MSYKFSENLIAIRKIKGLSQRDLAKLTGISNRVIAYYELNSSIPDLDKLEKLAKALNVSIADLVDPDHSDKKILSLNTRSIKKIQLLEQLPREDQKKVIDYIKDLIKKNKPNQLTETKN